MKLILHQFEHEIFSSGNIFWNKNSGERILISKKGEILNLNLIKKFLTGNAELFIEDQIDLDAYESIYSLYQKLGNEISMKEKIILRNELIAKLKEEFIAKENTSQFELDYLGWKLFSNYKASEGITFFEHDHDLFKRHLSVASSYAFCAFFLGHYEVKFLNNLFSKTLLNLMNLGKDASLFTLKEKLEYLRLQESFNADDCADVRMIADDKILFETVFFERYDGSGPRKINSREMDDLEIILIAINQMYGPLSGEGKNILKIIENDEFNCSLRIKKLLKKTIIESAVS